MDDRLLGALARNEVAGSQQFRRLFFEALAQRRLEECRQLLDVLTSTNSPRLQRDHSYHQAILHIEQRQFDRAETLLRSLLDDPELSPVQRARALVTAVVVASEQGRWPEAETFARQAIEAYAAIDDPVGRAKAHNNLAIAIVHQFEQETTPRERLLEAMDHHQQALTFLHERLRLSETEDDEEIEWEIACNWHGLGKIHALLGEYVTAGEKISKYIFTCVQQKDGANHGMGLSDIAALVYVPLDQQEEAAVALDEAVALLRTHDEPLNLAEALTRRGNLLAAQGKTNAALADYTEAMAQTESIQARMTAPVTRAGYRSTVESVYAAPLSLHLRLGDADAAFNVAERARSRVLADLLDDQTIRPHADIPADLLARRQSIRDELEQAYAGDVPKERREALELALANLDHQIDLVDPAYTGLHTVAPLTAEEVRRKLPANSALLTFVGDANDHLWILLVTQNSVQATLAPKVSVRWLRTFLSSHLDGRRRGHLVPDWSTGHLVPSGLYAMLYSFLIAPIIESLKAVQTLYIVPFGPLYYVPLGALSAERGGTPSLLADGQQVVYVPSATILFNYCHARPPSTRHGTLAVAPLDAQLRVTVGAAYRLATTEMDRTLIGEAAACRTFLEQAGAYRTVAFLGHAHFDPVHPMASRLQFSDGSLHASEILRTLRLDADLVVLAACESGRSRVLRGDEILGLTRAMSYAGTPSLLVTLWKVHEVPTRLLVERFFRQLPALDAAQALAQTQCWLRDLSYAEATSLMANWNELSPDQIQNQLTGLWQMTHPQATPQEDSPIFAHSYFWSPYILIGDRSHP